MEKIQSAIAKARAARDAQSPDRVLRSTDTTTASVEMAWQHLNGFTPHEKKLNQQRIVTIGGAQQGASYFDILRTKVLQQMRANGWRRLAITSPTPACGKSTVVLNLTFSLARQIDLRVIVCEMDLRRPSIAKTLGLKGQQDFVNTLRGESDFADQAVRIRSNMALGVNRQIVRNPSELLQGPSVARAISAIETRYDPSILIFDMPPMLATDDAMAFVGQADCALLVAAAGTTTISQIDKCERDLASQTNVLGVVMNKVRYMERDAGYDEY